MLGRRSSKWLGSISFGLALVLWGACGGVIAIGRKLWSIDTTLRVHLVAAPVLAFLVAAAHRELAPDFDPLLRAAAITIIVMLLDALVVAPLFETKLRHVPKRHRDVAALRCDIRRLLGCRRLGARLARLRQPATRMAVGGIYGRRTD